MCDHTGKKVEEVKRGKITQTKKKFRKPKLDEK